MSRAKQTETIKQNLFWIVGLALCVILLIASSLGFIGTPSESDPSKDKGKAKKVLSGNVAEKYTKRLSEPPRQAPTKEDEARRDIADYTVKADAKDTPDEERPDYLLASGNLTRDYTHDYETAKNYYERIILEFPNYPRLAQAYRNLYACYMDLGDEQNARWVCTEAMKKFPPDSMDYQWAQIKLGLIPDPRVKQGSVEPEKPTQEIPEPLAPNPLEAPEPDPNQQVQ